MQRYGGRRCSDCQHWQPYPLLDRFGTCDYPDSKYYDRGISATNEPCERFILNSRTIRRCGDCNGWYPLDVQPHLGECRSSISRSFGKPVFRDTVSGDCFEERSLLASEFTWCGTCRQTVPRSDMGAHRSHALFRGTSQFSVDEMMEFTSAAD